ncbi:MAG: Stp1/IreP family PP2C-type Ser/Thr phosphatase [Solirubrobacterales bacterium]
MLKVVEQAFRTDTGRQRDANEDSYFARSPVFAVADGMGGAQAGEVASRLAAESFEAVQRGDEPPEAYLRAIAKTANARIHRLSQSDESRSGMGTTFTAALLEDEEVGFAHVGDSRGYLFRDGELKLLTSDHSLVEELRRQGRLTDEQAEDHPQRSIITRALGPERDVEVDTMTYRARPGDVYLLCSDGLTTMIKDDRIAEILRRSGTLDEAVDQLVSEANAAGGRDTVTVVAFRVAEAEVAAERPEDLTLVGPAAEEAGLTAAGVEAAAERERAAAPARRRARPAPASRGRRWPRRAVTALVVLVVTVGLAALAAWGVRQVYFLGTDSGGRLALYRGLPYDLPLSIHLYSEVYSAPVQVNSVPASRRDSATNHTLRFHDDAVDLLDDLQAAADRTIAARQRNAQPSPNAGKQPTGGKKGDSTQGSGAGGGKSGGAGGGGAGGAGSGGKSGGAG